MDSESLYLASGKNAENIINSPFPLGSEVRWVLDGNITDDEHSSNKNDGGALIITLWPEIVKSDLLIEAISGSTVIRYTVFLVEVPPTVTLAPGGVFEIDYPSDHWSPEIALETSTFEHIDVSLDPTGNKIKIEGVDPGFERLQLLFKNCIYGSVDFKIPVRVLDQNFEKLGTTAVKEEIENAEIVSAEDRQVNDVTVLKGDCTIEVHKGNKGAPLLTELLTTVNSIIIGKASSSTPGVADINLMPYLSDRGRNKCSRRQLKVFISSDNRLCVKNIGTCSVLVKEIEVLQPGSHVFLSPPSSITIADEITIILKERA